MKTHPGTNIPIDRENNEQNARHFDGLAEYNRRKEFEDTARFDVFIVEIATGKAMCLIGANLREDKAERRIETGISRTNDRHFVTMKPAGKHSVGDIL